MYGVVFRFGSDLTGVELLPILVTAFGAYGSVDAVDLRELALGVWEASISFTPSANFSCMAVTTVAGYATGDFLAAIGGSAVVSAAQVQATQWQAIIAAIAVPVLLGLLSPVMGKLTKKIGLEEK